MGRRGAGAGFAVAWLAAVVVVSVAQHAFGVLPPERLAATPAAVANGRVWLLATSGFEVAGPPWLELPLAAVLVAAVIAVLGARTFWVAAVAGHVGATLIAYAGVGVLWLLARPRVERVVHQPDYGISAVMAAALGALVGGLLARGRSGWATAGLLAAGAGVLLGVTVSLPPTLADVEHLLAFALGAIVAWALSQP
ncbi:MAG TPA: hypothetical protein VNS09_11055 [Solirubrobacter sp.]|nr:hypothetical protein [Solirubrobacter sp.]